MAFQKPFLITLFFAAGCAFGYALSRSPGPSGSAPVISPMAADGLTLSQAMAGQEPREQLRWLAGHVDDEIDFPAALADLTRQGLVKNRQAHSELMTLWASRDPEAALAYATKLRGMNRYFAFAGLAEGWAQKDMASMAQWLNSEEGRKQLHFRSSALAAIARRDPNLAFSLLNESDTRRGTATYYELFNTLGKTDPRAGLHLLGQLDAEKRGMATSSFLYAWSSNDPEAALSWAQGLSDPERRREAMRTLANSLGYSDPDRAATLISSELSTPGLSRETVQGYLYSLLNSWSKKDPAAAQAWIASLPAEYQKVATETYRNQLAQANPDEYLKSLEGTKSLSENERFMLSNSLATLARNSPAQGAKAVEWLQRNRDWLPAQTMASVLSSMLYQSPELSPQLLPMLARGSTADSAYQTAGEKWADKDGAAAARFLASLPPGSERDAFTQGMFQHAVSLNVQEAYRLVEATPEGKLRSAMLQSLASGSKEYQGTADWITSHYGSTQEATNAVDTVLRQWSNASPAEAADWLKKTPAGAEKDRYIHTFSTAIVRHDPDTAIEWASSIGDEKARDRAMEAVAREWLGVDRNAAREWIATAPFTDKVKERLLK